MLGRLFMRVWVVALLAVLAACASPPAIQGGGDSDFSRTGRFAVTVAEPGVAQQAVQGGFAWRDSQQAQQLDLANPMGSVLARVEMRPGQAVLIRSDGSRQVAPDADALLAQVVGTDMPVQGLKLWLQGRVDAAAGQVARNDEGQPVSFVSNGWSVRLSRYDSLGPRMLLLERRQAAQQVRVRLVIDGA
ncbi:MAG TPA: outer membrane lipoprotein LolB [Pusillimonas sp.]|jgi:outer membrane lipoprotein LolB|nr:outer membrane lipoprotein LolB [Pusillimonas sp.]MBC42255.1 outer membrane lipoprotein LolB [Pusillimonas sp.]HBT33162.1 outer membrane lipoprotein LolB [Pusillimonas sp.]|tara:strand:+ start:53909 stop:54475 length:567 start_codon:yes stop_codon:yes gene_type:complete